MADYAVELGGRRFVKRAGGEGEGRIRASSVAGHVVGYRELESADGAASGARNLVGIFHPAAYDAVTQAITFIGIHEQAFVAREARPLEELLAVLGQRQRRDGRFNRVDVRGNSAT